MSENTQNPLMVIIGLDPEKHKIPPLLNHHLKKIGKDIPIVFWSEEDLNSDTWESIRKYAKKIGFKPTLKDSMLPPNKPNIKIVQS